MLQKKIEGLIDLVRAQKVRLILSLLLIIAGFIGLREIDPKSILVLSGLVLIIIGSLPWLVVLRRALWVKRYTEGGKWLKAANVCLWLTLFTCPVTLTCLWLWKLFVPVHEGFAGMGQAIAMLVYAILSLYATYSFSTFSFLIQLWRDQWQTKLNVITLIYLCLLSFGAIAATMHMLTVQ